MSYPGPPYWPPEFDDDWCPSVELDIDVPSCEECPLLEECPLIQDVDDPEAKVE